MSEFSSGQEENPKVAGMVTGGNWKHGMPERFGNVSFDTRLIKEGEVFVALRSRRDGHEFVTEAKNNGAAALLVDRELACDVPQLVVGDTSRALLDLGHWRRASYGGELVLVTGSSGKSTTKEMIRCVFAAFAGKEAVLSSEGSYNNHIGLPITLLRLRPQHGFAVLEAGMNNPGEIAKHTRLAQPGIGVITNAGRAHLGQFDNEEQIARAKGEMITSMSTGSPVVINVDDKFYPLWRSMGDHVDLLGFSHSGGHHAVCRRVPDRDFLFSFEGSNRLHEVCLQVEGRHNEENALAAATVCWRIGIPCEDIRKGLENFDGVPGRQEIVEVDGGVLINDAYNASPESFMVALQGLGNRPESHKILVMGDMLELGTHSTDLHVQVIRKAKELGVREVLAYGEHSAKAASLVGGSSYASKEELVEATRSLLDGSCVVLIKGSRGMHMEDVAQGLSRI